MSTMGTRTYYVLFGYYHPSAWELIEGDTRSDFESIGVLAINAPDEVAALAWGKRVVAWYISQLYSKCPHLTYNWPLDDDDCWVETSMPEGCENCVRALGEIQVNSYPDFDKMKDALTR